MHELLLRKSWFINFFSCYRTYGGGPICPFGLVGVAWSIDQKNLRASLRMYKPILNWCPLLDLFVLFIR